MNNNYEYKNIIGQTDGVYFHKEESFREDVDGIYIKTEYVEYNEVEDKEK